MPVGLLSVVLNQRATGTQAGGKPQSLRQWGAAGGRSGLRGVGRGTEWLWEWLRRNTPIQEGIRQNQRGKRCCANKQLAQKAFVLTTQQM